MGANSASLCLESRLLIVVGLALWLLAGVSSVWEVLALQAPESPFHLGILAGPISQLRSFSFGLGTGLVFVAWLWPHVFGAGSGRLVLALLTFGALVQTGALLAAAAHGMLAVQVFDPRADARTLLY